MPKLDITKIKEMQKRYNELSSLFSQPQILSNRDKIQKYSRERKELQEVLDLWKEYTENKNEIRKLKEMIEDAKEDEEIKILAEKEKEELSPKKIKSAFRFMKKLSAFYPNKEIVSTIKNKIDAIIKKIRRVK